MPWIREILTTHTSYLMSISEAADTLSALYQCISSRLVVTKQLQQLNGRLELLMSQASNSASAGQAEEFAPANSFDHAMETPKLMITNGINEEASEEEEEEENSAESDED